MRAVWEIDIDDARTPLDAALEAYWAMRAPDTIATVFFVYDATGERHTIDLSEVFRHGDEVRIPADPNASS